MSTVPSIVEQPPVAEDPPAGSMAYRHWLVLGCCPLGAPIVTGRLWIDPAGRMQAGGGPVTISGLRLSGSLLPDHWLQGLPAVAQVLPDRFCILGAGAAGAVLAFSIDSARSAAWQRGAWRRGVPVTIAVLAVPPLIPLPYQAVRVPPVPAGWQAALGRPAAILAVTSETSRLGRFLIDLLGRPAFRVGRVLAWRR